MTEQQACTLCGAGGHTAAQCHWREQEAFEEAVAKRQGKSIAWVASYRDESTLGYMAASLQHAWWAWQARAALAQPSPAPELERPEVLYGPSTHICWTPDHTPREQRKQVVLVEASALDAFVAQHDRIVGALRSERDDAIRCQLSAEQSLSNVVGENVVLRERIEAAQARVAELEGALRNLLHSLHGYEGFGSEVALAMRSAKDALSGAGKAPVAQAGQVPSVTDDMVDAAMDALIGGGDDEGNVTHGDVERALLAALAAAPAQGMPTEAELEAAGLGYPLSKEEAVARWNDRSGAQPAQGGRDE